MSTARHAALALAGIAAIAFAQAPPRAEPPPAFVEIDAPTEPVWVQQRVVLVVRIGFDAAFFRDRAIALFQQRLDQPFRVLLPWLQGREDRAASLLDGPADGVRVAVGDRVQRWSAAGQREVDGRRYTLLELRAEWLPLVAGEQTIEPVELHYAFASRFEEHLLRGRQPVDRQEVVVRSAPQPLRVRTLPSVGRPAGFQGAVGEFLVVATVRTAAVSLGDAFPLELQIAGAGNLDRVPPLAWPELPGFVVQGLVEQKGPGVRQARFDVLAVRAGAAELPPIPFVFFSPAQGAYRTVLTAPLPLRVAAATAPLPPRVVALVDADAARLAAAAWPWWYCAVGAAGAAVVAAAVARGVVRRRRRTALQRALAALEVAAAAGTAERGFRTFLAACGLGDPPQWDQPARRGAKAAPLDRLRALDEAFAAARYGGVAPSAGEVMAAAADLVRFLV